LTVGANRGEIQTFGGKMQRTSRRDAAAATADMEKTSQFLAAPSHWSPELSTSTYQ
ncbi:hypothetical protein ACJMK2_005972, partial [Sinanodonta woodiana]